MQPRMKPMVAAARIRADGELERGRHGMNKERSARGFREDAEPSAFVLQGRQLAAKERKTPPDAKGAVVTSQRQDEGCDAAIRLPAAVPKRFGFAYDGEVSRGAATALPQPTPSRVEGRRSGQTQRSRRSNDGQHVQAVVGVAVPPRGGTDAAAAMDLDVDGRSETFQALKSYGRVRPQTADSSTSSQRPEQEMSAWQRLTRPVSAPYSDEVFGEARASSEGEEITSAPDTGTILVDEPGALLGASTGLTQEPLLASQILSDYHEDTDWAGRFAHNLGHHPAVESGLFDGLGLGLEEEEGLASWLRPTNGQAVKRASVRLSGGVSEDELPDLSAPGLDDARALLRSWIDAEDTSGGLDGLHAGGVVREAWQRESMGRAARRLRESSQHQPESHQSWITNLAEGRRDEMASDDLESGADHGLDHELPCVQDADAEDGLQGCGWGESLTGTGAYLGDMGSGDGGGKQECDAEGDEESAPLSRWQALFSRDAVRQSITQDPVATDMHDDAIARPTKAWLRRAEDAEAARASKDNPAGVQRTGLLSSVAAARSAPAARVQPRDVLSQLETRHQMLAEKRQQRRASRDSSPSSSVHAGVDDSTLRPRTSEGTGTRGGARMNQEGAFQNDVKALRSQIRSHASRLCPRPPVSASFVPKRGRPGTAPGSDAGGGVRGAPLDSLEQLRYRRMGVGAKESSLVEDLAKHWSCRARAMDAEQGAEGEHMGTGAGREEEADVQELETHTMKENGGGRALLEGEEWQDMLNKHVEGFSASLNERLSDWSATRMAAGRETGSAGRDERVQEELLVCLPPDDHPFRQPYQRLNTGGGGGDGRAQEETAGGPEGEGLAREENPEEEEATCHNKGGEDRAATAGSDPQTVHAADCATDIAPVDVDALCAASPGVASLDTRGLVVKVVAQRQRTARAKFLRQHVVAWSHEAGRCARNARKLGKAVGVRKRVLCARALELLRLHAYEEQSARRHQGIEDGIVLMSQRRQQRMCEQGVRVWLGCVRREAEERRLQMERDKRREKMEAVVAAAARSQRERDRQISQAPLAVAADTRTDMAAGAVTAVTAVGGECRPHDGAQTNCAEDMEGVGHVGHGGSRQGPKATAEFHKSCLAIAQRQAQRQERRRALDEHYRAIEEEKALKQRQAEEARKVAQAEAKAQTRRQRLQEAMVLQEEINRRLQVKELLVQRRLLASMHWARATVRWRGIIPWKAAVAARTVALVTRWRMRLQRAWMSWWRGSCATTLALLAADRGIRWQRARAQHVRRLLLQMLGRWVQRHVRIQGARGRVIEFAAQAPLRAALSLWQHHTSIALQLRSACELRLQAQADEVYALSARRCFLRLWEEASSIARAERTRQAMRKDLKGKVSEWISQYRHQHHQHPGRGSRALDAADGHGISMTEGGAGREEAILTGTLGGSNPGAVASPPRTRPQPPQTPPRATNLGSDPEEEADAHAALSPTNSPTQRLIQKFRSQRQGLGKCSEPQREGGRERTPGDAEGGDPGFLDVPVFSSMHRERPEEAGDSPEPLPLPLRAQGDVLADSPTHKLITQLRCRRRLLGGGGEGERGCGYGAGAEGATAAERAESGVMSPLGSHVERGGVLVEYPDERRFRQSGASSSWASEAGTRYFAG